MFFFICTDALTKLRNKEKTVGSFTQKATVCHVQNRAKSFKRPSHPAIRLNVQVEWPSLKTHGLKMPQAMCTWTPYRVTKAYAKDSWYSGEDFLFPTIRQKKCGWVSSSMASAASSTWYSADAASLISWELLCIQNWQTEHWIILNIIKHCTSSSSHQLSPANHPYIVQCPSQ